MGLFDNLFGQQQRELNVPEAFAGILIAAVAADGVITGEESNGLVQILSRMKLYADYSGEKFGGMLNRLLGIVKREGVEAALSKFCKLLPVELHETVFANACDLVLADGVVEDEEKEYLNNLQRQLRVSGDQAITIVQVMVIKNKG